MSKRKLADLFETPELYTRYRTTDPDTSRDAAGPIIPKLSKIQKQVLSIFKEDAEMAMGFTDEELTTICNNKFRSSTKYTGDNSRFRTRRSELTAKGKIVYSGRKRKTRSGRMARVWILAHPNLKEES